MTAHMNDAHTGHDFADIPDSDILAAFKAPNPLPVADNDDSGRGAAPLITPGALTPAKEAPTEETLSREFALLHAARWRFDHTASRWYRWDGSRWTPDECNLIRHQILTHVRTAGTATQTPKIATNKTVCGVEALMRPTRFWLGPLLAASNGRARA